MSGAVSPEAVVRRMRRTRQLHRLGNIEWFDAAYRVYLLALFGGGGVLWLSSAVNDAELSPADASEFAAQAPAVLGLVAVLAVLAGLRGGAQGGPLALEAADVTHVLLAPVDRRAALMRPAVQRVRGAVFVGAVAGAIAGQLAGRRLPGTLPAWAAGGALCGATVGLLWAAAALLAHTLHIARWQATLVGTALLGWQTAAVAGAGDNGGIARHIAGPGDTVGSLGLWGWRQHTVDLAPVALALVAVTAGLVLLARTSLEALARRSALVAQLRFAVTMQDLRTVILLRRQLNQEHTRRQPWRRLGTRRHHTASGGDTRRALGNIVWRRGWHGLLRFPSTRIVRLVALAAGVGVLQTAAARGTTPAVLGAGLLAFVLGLEVMESLSQEVDQPDLTDGLPVARGELLVRHLAAPAVALVPLAVVAAAAATLTAGTADAIAPAAIMALPTMLGGAAGGVVSIVRDAPDPASTVSQQAFVPPEMAGFSTTLRLMWPVAVSTLGTCTVLLVQAAADRGDSLAAAAARGAVGSLLVAGFVAYWTKMRDPVRAAIRRFMDEGRAHTAAQRRAGSTR